MHRNEKHDDEAEKSLKLNGFTSTQSLVHVGTQNLSLIDSFTVFRN